MNNNNKRELVELNSKSDYTGIYSSVNNENQNIKIKSEKDQTIPINKFFIIFLNF